MKSWLKKKLGITALEVRLRRLEKLDHFTLADVVNKLSESYIVLAHDDQRLMNTIIEVPPDKAGVIALGERTMIANNRVKLQSVKKTVIYEPLEESQ